MEYIPTCIVGCLISYLMRRVSFVGQSLDDLKQFPENVKREAGYQLDKVQRGLIPNDWKSTSNMGVGVKEIQIKDATGIYRVIYVTKYLDTLFVLHAFKKKTQKIAKKDMNIIKERLKIIEQEIKK